MMGKQRTPRNGLQQAMRQLLQAQALAQLQISMAAERIAKAEERHAEKHAEFEERFQRIERMYAEIIRMLEELPEAIKSKIGFAPGNP